MSTRNCNVAAWHSVIGDLSSLDSERRKELIEKAEAASLADKPHNAKGVKQLKHHDFLAIRIGKQRALCDKHLGRIRILVLAHREDAYKPETIQLAKLRGMQE